MYEIISVENRSGNGFNNLTGERFGRLTVLGLSSKKAGRKSYWVCQCDCGEKHLARSDSLKCGLVTSCGCKKEEQNRINLGKVTHGDTPVGKQKRLYHTWQGIKKRIYNQKNKRYVEYGGRGISLCKDWEKYEVFREWAHKAGYNDDLTIERIDVDGNYEPSNCKWIPFSEQAINRRSTVWIEWKGERKNIKQWSDELGINYGTLHSRYYRSGMRPPQLFEPIIKKTPR